MKKIISYFGLHTESLHQCGSLSDNAPIGSIVVPYYSFGVTRNYDYFFQENQGDGTKPYHITRAVSRLSVDVVDLYLSLNYKIQLPCDKQVHDSLVNSLQKSLPSSNNTSFMKVIGNIVNASADSFYSSQARKTTFFLDENEELIKNIRKLHPEAQTFEMETFLLNHLAKSSNESKSRKVNQIGQIRTGAAQIV